MVLQIVQSRPMLREQKKVIIATKLTNITHAYHDNQPAYDEHNAPQQQTISIFNTKRWKCMGKCLKQINWTNKREAYLKHFYTFKSAYFYFKKLFRNFPLIILFFFFVFLFSRNFLPKSKSHSSIVAPPPGGVAIGIGPQLPPLTGAIKLRHVGSTGDATKPDSLNSSLPPQLPSLSQFPKQQPQPSSSASASQDLPEEQFRQPTALPPFLQGGLRRSSTQVS